MNKKTLAVVTSIVVSAGLGVSLPFVVMPIINSNNNIVTSVTEKTEIIEIKYNSIEEINNAYENAKKYAVIPLENGLSNYKISENNIFAVVERKNGTDFLTSVVQKISYSSINDGHNVELAMTSKTLEDGKMHNDCPRYAVDKDNNEITYYLYEYYGGYAYSLKFAFPKIVSEACCETLINESKSISDAFLKLELEKYGYSPLEDNI